MLDTYTPSRVLVVTALLAFLTPSASLAQTSGTFIPTGQAITPAAAPGSTYQRLATGLRADGNADADDAVSSALSPDGKTLLVLTTGFNTGFRYDDGRPIVFPQLDPLTGLASAATLNQAEWIFVYDVSGGGTEKLQQIPIPNTFEGLAWDPSGSRFFVSGGIDDRVLIYKAVASLPAAARYQPDAPFVVLGHNSNDAAPVPTYDGGLLAGTPAAKLAPKLVSGAIAGGLDVSRDGKTLVVANFGGASASIVDLTSPKRSVVDEVAFFKPGDAVAQGEYPFWVAVKSDPAGAYEKAYVTSQRDDQVMVVAAGAHGSTLVKVIPVPSGPNKAALSADQRTLYVACGNDDSLVAIDTQTDETVYKVSLSRPGYAFKGAWPDDIAVSPHDDRLFVTLGGENAVAIVDLATRSVLGRIPVGWYPTSVRVSPDGSRLWAINEKSPSGPNPGQTTYSWNTPYGKSLNTDASNTYTWAIEKAGLVAMPVPDAAQLATLSRRVDANNGFGTQNDDRTMAFLRAKIEHVIYIVNENRTYDQVLGDLGNGGERRRAPDVLPAGDHA